MAVNKLFISPNMILPIAETAEKSLWQILKNIGTQLKTPVYTVGGYVRDWLLDRPCKDIDIVVLGNGVSFAQHFATAIGCHEIIIYENYGTAMVKMADYTIEFVGARKESYKQHSRKPIVENGTLLDDQLRRDFTINTLSISLNQDSFGQLIDPFHGIEDLRQRIIRTPTDPCITFSDDPLRMLRAIRFASTLNFTILPQTLEAIKQYAGRISIISYERISEELNKMIMAVKPSAGFKLLYETGLLALIFPEMQKLSGVEEMEGKAHKDNFWHTLQVLDNLSVYSDNLWLRWAAILHDIAKPQTKRFDSKAGWTFHGHEDKGAKMVPKIFTRLKLPLNEKMRYVQKLVQLHLRPIALVDDVVTDSAIRRLVVDAGDDLEDLMKLCRADITTRDKRKLNRYLANFKHVEERIAQITERDHLRNWQPPVSGEVIMERYKLNPSPTVGQIKLAIRNVILDGIVPNEFQAAINYLDELVPKIIANNNATKTTESTSHTQT
ncbi:MAG: CCA tRNA nucleotidyltransferase [Bacteroidia bacterium]|nr:CCA tRNA nucleotidyltransferase [Bacteroidia bacterium]